MRHSPASSALYRVQNVDAGWGVAEQLLRQVELNTRISWWSKTKDGEKGRNVPKPIPMPGDKPTGSERFGGKAEPLEDVRDWLGWGPEKPITLKARNPRAPDVD